MLNGLDSLGNGLSPGALSLMSMEGMRGDACRLTILTGNLMPEELDGSVSKTFPLPIALDILKSFTRRVLSCCSCYYPSHLFGDGVTESLLILSSVSMCCNLASTLILYSF